MATLNCKLGPLGQGEDGSRKSSGASQMERYDKSFKGEGKQTLEMKLTTPSY
jgi:hypothetical protein